MKTEYTYTIIRYVHDVVSGEFVNVGVILYAPEARFLGARFTASYLRLSRFYGGVDGEYVKSLLHYLEEQVQRVSRESFGRQGTASPPPADVMACIAAVLPKDDSALQASPQNGGLTEDPKQALATVFLRYVERYRHRSPKVTRQDDDILPLFRRPLEERKLLPYVQPKIIAAPLYEHEFPMAWKNGIWNTCDAVSFDLSGATDIVEKANKWVGRAASLRDSQEPFRLILLLGDPRREDLREAAVRAEKILGKVPGEVLLIHEHQADELANLIAKDVVDN